LNQNQSSTNTQVVPSISDSNNQTSFGFSEFIKSSTQTQTNLNLTNQNDIDKELTSYRSIQVESQNNVFWKHKLN
jgi:hypothetical protein